MARSTARLILALRSTAARLEAESVVYRWSHFGQCNCGQLAQTLTGLDARQLYHAAEKERGDWAEQAVTWSSGKPERHVERSKRRPELKSIPHVDYGDRPALDEGAWQPEDLGACPVAEVPMTVVFSQLIDTGLQAEDIAHLERLSDPEIRKHLRTNTVDFPYSDRTNVVSYLRAWAELLEAKLGRAWQPKGADLALAAE